MKENTENKPVDNENPFIITDKQKQAEYIWNYLKDICSGKAE